MLFKNFVLLKSAAILFALLSVHSYSQTPLASPSIEALSTSPSWLKLLHYKKGMFGGYTSIVDDPNFFIAEDGKQSPLNELNATLKLFLQNDDESLVRHCRFPARLKLLQRFNLIDHKQNQLQHCEEYAAWRLENTTESVWVIFPSAYLNSPSSMFGHTLFRFDAPPQNGKSSKLLSKAVNYAAKVDEKPNGFSYAFKGLFGGYPGYFSLMPYYEKVREYNRIENRDIWEYELNLTPDEIDWLLAHLWELDKIRFDYFFTTQNCSYQLLAILDFLRPEQNLTENFEWVAVPVETVRALHNQGWIVDKTFRPSKATEFQTHIDQLSKSERKIVANFKQDSADEIIEKIKDMPLERQQLILETGYKLVRLEKNAKKDKKKSITLLKYRSKLGRREENKNVQAPIPPEDGHYSRRLGLGYYHSDGLELGVLDMKLAYHSIEDPLAGFQKNSQINFLHGVVQFDEDDAKLEMFDVLNIRSLSYSNRYISRMAWQVNGGWERRLFENNQEYLTRQLNFGFGKVYELGEVAVYGLVGAQTELFNSVEHNYFQVGPRMDIGLMYQSNRFRYELKANATRFIDSELERANISLTTSLTLTRNTSLNFVIQHEETNWESDKDEGKLLLNIFY